jgi:hypothetical protein
MNSLARLRSHCQEFSLIQHIETFYERIEAIEFNMEVTDGSFDNSLAGGPVATIALS